MKIYIPPKQVPSTESWWLNPATFYDEARTRFPLTGAGNIDRTKVPSWTDSGPHLSVRMREFKRALARDRSSVGA